MFFLQIQLQRSGHNLKLILGYGDSNDGTGKALLDETAYRFDADLFDVSHGGPEFGSVVHPVRFRQLAGAINQLWRKIPADTNYVYVVESDLIWRASTLSSLLNDAEAIRKGFSDPIKGIIVAPQIKGSDGLFYDTWAFRENGKQFTKHPVMRITYESFLELDSVGSCACLDYGLAKEIYWPEEDVFVGLCRMAKEKGARIFMDGSLIVEHP